MLRRRAALCGLIVCLLALAPRPSVAQPAGFSEEAILPPGAVSLPTAFAFLPGGDLLIAARAGQLRLFSGGTLRTLPVYDRALDICDNGERGLLGVAVDPNFSSNRSVYVYYTFDRANTKESPAGDCPTNSPDQPANRVSRLTLAPDFTTATETVLVDNIPSPNGNHNAGDLHVGKDGYLYISTGDGGINNDTARYRYDLAGAILRITTDGAIPADNPFLGTSSARCYDPAPGGNKTGTLTDTTQVCQEIFAYGLRNPFRFAFDPNVPSTRFYINDVGQNSAEEISLGAAGADFGWNCYEGFQLSKSDGVCNPLPASPTPPLFEYRRPAPAGQSAIFNGCTSITAGAFVPDGHWPATYDGAYLFADYVNACRRIFALRTAGGDTLVPEQLLDGRVVTFMTFGPLGAEQALYYNDFFSGAIYALRYTGAANRAPVAALAGGPVAGQPLVASFDGSASADRDGGALIYLWSFGDGATAETTTPTLSHSYSQAGSFTVTLRVRDSQGAESFRAATLRVIVSGPNPNPNPDPDPSPQEHDYLPMVWR